MNIALGVTGCIAAYKAVEIMRGLQKAGVSVQVILTRAAAEFVTPLTFESLSSRNVITEMFPQGQNRDIQHISIAQSIRMLVVAPATANILGKFAHGIADDFLSTLYLSCPAPVVIAPAMNVQMWCHPAVRANVATLRSRGNRFIDPEPGRLACGMEGEGRLAPVEVIVARVLEALGADRSMEGLKVLVTAGPTVEDLDPVRFLSNRSSGKMGYAVALTALERGAEVHLVTGPTDLEVPPGAHVVRVRSAAEMKDAVLEIFPDMDIVVKAAAVADYRPAEQKANPEDFSLMDRWVLSKLQTLIAFVDEGMAEYKITETSRAIASFVDELSNWYVRRCRERFWGKGLAGDKLAAFETLFTVLTKLCGLLAPYVPFMTEAMYRNFESVKVFPGIREAVKRLKERGFRLGIVTSKTRREYANEFPQFGVDKFFDVIVTADDTVEHKPCPEPLLKYLERAGANRERALYIGDSIHDLRAAKAAGVDFALAEWGLNCAEPEKARYRLSHPDDLFGIL